MHAVLEGRSNARAHERSERAWLAWQIANLPRMKKLPRLSKFMQPPKRRVKQRPQSWEQMKDIAALWAAAGNGEGDTQH